MAVGGQIAAAFVLAVARTAAFVLVTPPFNTRGVPGQARVALAIALALPLTPGLVATAPALTSGELVVRLLVRLAPGLAPGCLLMAWVPAVQAAGDLTALVGGFTSSVALAPLVLTQT